MNPPIFKRRSEAKARRSEAAASTAKARPPRLPSRRSEAEAFARRSEAEAFARRSEAEAFNG